MGVQLVPLDPMDVQLVEPEIIGRLHLQQI